jgi:formylglycine-generating enzyme required for sulfatase activity
VTEVTQGQCKAVANLNPSENQGSDDLPVERVSWRGAVTFCNMLSTRENLPPFYGPDGQSVKIAGGTGYRLQTEAEWEYACRAGTTTTYSFGDDASRLGDFAWIGGNSGGRTHPVGEKPANAFGLCDMHGNVFEWCWDAFDDRFYSLSPPVDPTGPASGSKRVFRGGGCTHAPESARSTDRAGGDLDFANLALGFRIARYGSKSDQTTSSSGP